MLSEPSDKGLLSRGSTGYEALRKFLAMDTKALGVNSVGCTSPVGWVLVISKVRRRFLCVSRHAKRSYVILTNLFAVLILLFFIS